MKEDVRLVPTNDGLKVSFSREFIVFSLQKRDKEKVLYRGKDL
jgi:hypothetical protein